MHRLSAGGFTASTLALVLCLSSPAAGATIADPPDPLGTAEQTASSLIAQQTGAGASRKAAGTAMTGRFEITSGACTSGAVPKGSYFSMRDPSGGGVSNGNSPCTNQEATPLKAGTEGLTPGRMQPFAASPGSSDAIVQPATFFGSPFAVGTQTPDKQSSKDAAAPSIRDDGGKLSGEIRSYQAFYNGSYYNQGAPKPDGSTPGSTTDGVSGTYDASSGAFTLDWKSTIVGGAFNNFTGVWHLAGVYRGAAASSGSSSSSGGSTGTASAGSTTSQTTPSAGGSTTTASPGSSLADTGLGTGPATLTLLLLGALAALLRRNTHPVRSH